MTKEPAKGRSNKSIQIACLGCGLPQKVDVDVVKVKCGSCVQAGMGSAVDVFEAGFDRIRVIAFRRACKFTQTRLAHWVNTFSDTKVTPVNVVHYELGRIGCPGSLRPIADVNGGDTVFNVNIAESLRKEKEKMAKKKQEAQKPDKPEKAPPKPVKWGRQVVQFSPEVKANQMTYPEGEAGYKPSPFVTYLGTIPEIYETGREHAAVNAATAVAVLDALGMPWPPEDDTSSATGTPPNRRNWITARLWTGFKRPGKLKASAVTEHDAAIIVKLAKRFRAIAIKDAAAATAVKEKEAADKKAAAETKAKKQEVAE